MGEFNTTNSQKFTPKNNNDNIVRYDIAKVCDYNIKKNPSNPL